MALTYPLITLSTRAQVESKKADTSTLQAAKRIVDREGIIGLYAGLESALFGISVTNFVYYYCKSQWLQYDISANIAVQGTSSPALSSSERPAKLASQHSSPWPRAPLPAPQQSSSQTPSGSSTHA